MAKVLGGEADAGIRYDDLCVMLKRLGYEAHNSGSSHTIFRKAGCDLINIQNAGGKAKAYQVRQIRAHLENQK